MTVRFAVPSFSTREVVHVARVRAFGILQAVLLPVGVDVRARRSDKDNRD